MCQFASISTSQAPKHGGANCFYDDEFPLVKSLAVAKALMRREPWRHTIFYFTNKRRSPQSVSMLYKFHVSEASEENIWDKGGKFWIGANSNGEFGVNRVQLIDENGKGIHLAEGESTCIFNAASAFVDQIREAYAAGDHDLPTIAL